MGKEHMPLEMGSEMGDGKFWRSLSCPFLPFYYMGLKGKGDRKGGMG